MKVKTNLLIIILLAFPISTLAQTKHLPKNWKRIKICDFTFSAPQTFQDLKVKGIDSCVGSFQDEELSLTFDYGRYSGKFQKSESTFNFKQQPLLIGGRLGKFVTFESKPSETVKRYYAGIYVELGKKNRQIPMITKFNMCISGRSEKVLETARQIFKTIKF
jgi:hypothetical protein